MVEAARRVSVTTVGHVKEGRGFYIARGGPNHGFFGNPIRLNHECQECKQVHRNTGDTLACYEKYLRRRLYIDSYFRERVEGLKGKRLLCFCKKRGDEPCHGDVLARYVDGL